MATQTRKLQERSLKTREKIIAAARELFVQHGFAGSSLGDIAKLAKINQSLIHHHFGSKQDLWNVVRDEIYDDYVDDALKFIEQSHDDDAAKMIKSLLSMRFKFLKAHPELARIMAWQSLSDMPVLTSERALSVMKGVLEQITMAQKLGRINASINPKMLAAIVFITTAGWFQNDYSWMFGENLSDAERDKVDVQFLESLTEIFLKGVLA